MSVDQRYEPYIENVVRACVPRHLPVMMTRDEVGRVLAELQGTPRLMAMLPYGSGLRSSNAPVCASRKPTSH